MKFAMRYPLIPTLIFAFLLPGPSFSQTSSGQHPEEFQGTVTRKVQMKYLLFIPQGYNTDFHGAKDNLVPIGGPEELINALKALGNDVRFTVLADRDHYILDVYENQELYSWFLQHRLNDSPDKGSLEK